MYHNVLSRSIRDFESLCYLSNANTAILEHNFLHFFNVIVVNRGGWTTRMRQVFYDLTTPSLNALCHSNTYVLDRVDSPKHFCNIFNDSVAVIPLKTQNFKQTRSIFFFYSKNRQTTFLRRKPMAAKHTLMDVSRSNFIRLSKKVFPT